MKILGILLLLNLFFIQVALTEDDQTAISPVVPSDLEIKEKKKKARLSVWKLENDFFEGTGFVIGPNLMVTSFNTAYKLLKDGASIEAITLSQEGHSRSLKINKVLALSAIYNLALFETAQRLAYYTDVRQRPLESDEEGLYMLGYPKGNFQEIKKTGVVFFSSSLKKTYYLFAVNQVLFEGAGGGPVFDNRGEVIGIASVGSNAGGNLLSIISVERLKEFLTGSVGLECTSFAIPRACIEKAFENTKEAAQQGYAPAQWIMLRLKPI